jgi:hypothetical protein
LDFTWRRRVRIDGFPKPEPTAVYPALDVCRLAFGCGRLLFGWHILFHNLLSFRLLLSMGREILSQMREKLSRAETGQRLAPQVSETRIAA